MVYCGICIDRNFFFGCIGVINFCWNIVIGKVIGRKDFSVWIGIFIIVIELIFKIEVFVVEVVLC